MARTWPRFSRRRISLFFHESAKTVVKSADRAVDTSDSTLKRFVIWRCEPTLLLPFLTSVVNCN